MKVQWSTIADTSNQHGYSVINDRFQRAFSDCGVEIVSPRSFDWDASVTFALPLAWMVSTGKKDVTVREDMVYHTMFECTPLPQDWVSVLNRTGLVWSPSRYCTTLFRDSGVTRPIMTAGYGVNRDVFPYYDRSGRDGLFKFIVWNRGLVSRKNLLDCVKAFHLANLPKNEAIMEIKLNRGFGAPNFFWRDAQDERVPVDNVTFAASDDWSDGDLAWWLASADAMVYASKGEGFGLMPLEAGATGLPIICAYNTGMMDYLSSDVAYLIETEKMERSKEYSDRFGGDLYWCKPSIDQMVEHIRYVFYNREESLKTGKRFSQMAHKMTWEKAAIKAISQIKQYLANRTVSD